jgi:6,7-dimethyl-8-ribityllumazine synthase
MHVIDAKPLASQVKLACVVTHYYQDLTDQMLADVQSRCADMGLKAQQLTVVWVPGAVEIPVVAKKLAAGGQYDAIMCLGIVIKGETAHFDYVAQQCSQGCQQVAITHQLPVVFGVLTTYDEAQALARINGEKGHVGIEVVDTALHMVSVMQQLPVTH